ncbi:MAG: hypothetical protein ACREH5_03170 [Candidatus Omnitrophota bacterium]
MANPEKVMRELIEECLNLSDRVERTGSKKTAKKTIEVCKGASFLARMLGRPGFAALAARRASLAKRIRLGVNGG